MSTREAGMVNTRESAIKIVTANKRKWLMRLNQKVTETGSAPRVWAFVTRMSPGRKQAPNPTHFYRRNVGTPYRSLRGQLAARLAYGGAGLGCRKKRMPGCNGPDTGWDITRHESEPTSDG